MHKITLLFICLPILAFGQKAKFFADTTWLARYIREDSTFLNHSSQMEWLIKGQALRWGSPAIEVMPSPSGIDSIFFKLYRDAPWDTLICKMQADAYYPFTYNPCSHDFEIRDTAGIRTLGIVSFQLSRPSGNKFLGTIDGYGVIMSTQPVVISTSIWDPKVRNEDIISVQQIRKCRGKNCLNVYIRVDASDSFTDFKYRIKKRLATFQYVQVNEKPVVLTLNVDTGLVELK